MPGSDATDFERVAASRVYRRAVAREKAAGTAEPELRRRIEATLLGKTTMFSPQELLCEGLLYNNQLVYMLVGVVGGNLGKGGGGALPCRPIVYGWYSIRCYSNPI